jgi:hypothetical protein
MANRNFYFGILILLKQKEGNLEGKLLRALMANAGTLPLKIQ